MDMRECRTRLRAFGRRRLLRLRDRIDHRIERLERKQAALREPVAPEREPSRRAPRPTGRRRRPAPQVTPAGQ